jgi:hypothetical protein
LAPNSSFATFEPSTTKARAARGSSCGRNSPIATRVLNARVESGPTP